MSNQTLEDRVAALEAEVADLKHAQKFHGESAVSWWEQICGRFKDDPAYEEAMQYGREYREALRLRRRTNYTDRSGEINRDFN